MYRNKKWATSFFLLTWMVAVVAFTSEAWYSAKLQVVANIGPTNYCITLELPDYTVVASIIPFVYETIVFSAISMRLATVSMTEPSTGKEWMKLALFGDYLPAFSKAMLQDGQLYYL